MSRKFQRTKENFVCSNCDHEITGTGYTNHCPNCLWSKHVDINPGDRASDCKGMMKPIGIGISGGETRILHECKLCGHNKWNKVADDDNREVIIDLSKNSVPNL
jgi:hypothetical protein